MLKLSGVLKFLPFVFTEIDGKDHNLEVREFTISDTKKLIDLQKGVDKNEELSIVEKSEIIMVSNAICSVRIAGTNEYYWDSIDDFSSKNYPSELSESLYSEVVKINKVETTTLAEKKS